MSWLSDSNANRFKKSYIQGFLDVSGGNLIVESSSTIQVMSSEFSGQAALLIKPDRFSVFTGQSSYDISYETFAALGFLGVSYQYTTTDIYNRIQFIGSSTLTGNKTFVGSDSSLSDLVVYGNISTVNNGNITGAKNFLLTGDASLNSKLYVAGNARIDSSLLVNTDLSVNQNMFVTGRSQFNNDVSMNRNVDIGTGNNSVAINKDISANIALDVSGTTVLRGPLSITRDLSLNQSLQIGSDLSVNRFLYVGNNALFNTDLSVNQNLYVTGRALFGRPPPNGTAFEVDLSGQMRIYETVGTAATATTGSLVLKHADASGASSIVFQSTNDAGSDYAYIQYQENVGGASQKGLLTIGVENESGSGTTADRISLYAASGSGFVGVNTKTPVYNLDISGTAGVTGALITNVINPTNTGSDMTFGAAQLAGNLEIGNNASRSGNIFIGTGNTSKTITVGAASTGTTTLQGGTITINPGSILELGNNDADVAITMGRDQTTGTIDIGNKADRTAAINIGTGSSAKTMSIGGTNTTLQMYGVDASFAGNVKLGSGSKSVAINKDISSNFALDVSGATMLRGVLSTVADVSINGRIFASGDVSLNQKLFVNQDTSLNGNLSVNGRAIFNADVSLNNNTRLGIGNNSVAINKDISSNFSLDVSGTTVLRGVTITLSDVSINSRLFVQSDVSLNQKLFVNSDVSINSNLSVGQVLTVNNRALFSSDVSLNRNVDIGAGNNSVAINKDISSNFALDVSGATMLRGALSTLSDVSINGKLSVGGDISLNGNITIGNIQTIGVGLKQPPAAMTANVTNIPGHGSYYAYTSSLQPDSLNPFVVFDNGNLSYNTPSFYTTAVGDPSINVWSGTDTISDVAAVAYPGYRFHIDLPYQINLSSFSYTAGPGRYPVQGTMLGSNNGTSWYNIISFDLSASLNNSTTQSTILTFPYDVSSNTSFYSKYALVTRSIGCPTLPGTRVTLREIQLYGNNNILSTKGIGTTSLGVSENLTVGSTANLYGNVTIGNIENVYNRVGAAKLLIMEPSGTVATATSGSLVLQHGDASGVSSIVFRSANDQGSDYAYIQYQENVGGASQKGLLTIGVENESGSGATADRMSLYAAGGSGFVGVNTLDPQYHLDVSGNLRVSGNMITSLDVSLNRNTRLGTGSNSVAVNKDISSNFALDVSGATMLRGVLSTLSDISINGRLFASSDVSLNQKLFVQQDASLNSNLSIGQALTVNSRALFISDVSLNANTRLGAGRNSIAVNKDISSNFALDVSGITNLRAPLYTLSDVSINGKLFATGDASFNTSLFVGQDLSVNRFLYVNNATLFNGDISSNQNLYVAGKATFGRPPSNTTYELDVSGQVRIYEPSGSNVNSASSVATLTLEHGDASGCSSIMFKSPSTVSNNDYAYIKYQDLSGATTNAGLLTLGIENDATGVNAGKISLFSGNGSGYVGINTLTPAFNLDISGNANVSSSLITNAIDPSNVASTLNIAATQTSGILNIATEATRTGAINIGTGTSNGHNVTIGGTANGSTTTLQGRDTVVIPDPVGQLFLGNNVTTGNVFLGNAMTGGNLFIGPVGGSSSTTVINFATAAGTRTMSVGGSGTTLNVYAPDVSFSGNVRLGQSNTTNRVSINKDISSDFALDVSGATNFRGIVSTLSDISINGRLFTSGDVSLNQKLFVSNDISTNSNVYVGNTVFTNKIATVVNTANIDIGATQSSGVINIGQSNSRTGAINIGTQNNTGSPFTIQLGHSSGIGPSIGIGIWSYNGSNGELKYGGGGQLGATGNFNLFLGASSTLSMGNSMTGGTINLGRTDTTASSTAINIGNGSASTGVIQIGRGPAIKIANGTNTNIDISASGTLALRGTTVTAPTTALDNSSNQIATTAFVKDNISNLVGNAGPALDTLYELATAINNDASFSYTIVSAINLRSYDASVVHLTGTESIAGNKTFTNDTVMSQNLTVNQNLTTVQKGYFGYGTGPVGTPYELDVSGQMRIYELIGSDVSTNTSVATLTLEHGDASGSSSIMFKSPSTATNGDYAYIKYQDLSGGTTNTGLLTIGVENDPTAAATADKISLYAAGGSGYVGVNTRNPAFNLDISGNANVSSTLITNTIDVSNAASTLNIAASQVGGAINIGVNTGTARTGAINLGTGGFVGHSTALNWGSSSNSGQLEFRGGTFNFTSTGNLTFNTSYAPLTANIITSTRNTGTVNLVTGDPSGALTNAFTGNATNTSVLNIATGSRTIGSDINIASNTSSAETLNIGTGNGRTGPINIGTGTTGIKTIGIGGTNTTVNFTGRSVTVASDVSLNANTRIGTGSSINAINKDLVAGFALDVSGNVRITSGGFFSANTIVAQGPSTAANIFGNSTGDITFGGAIGTSNTITIASASSVGKVNINGNIKLGPGTKYVTVNKDLSTNFIFDVSGDSMFRNKLFVTQDASFGSNVIVVGDTSLNGNLIVGKRSLFNQDVSMTQNLDIGSGNSSVAINKDISSNFALDVSGLTNVRGDLSIIGGTITVNGLPVSGGGAGTSLTTQGVKVGTDANYFVTIDKTNFYNDPSLVIYYNFDTSFNNGTLVKNFATTGSTYDASFNRPTNATTTGMIDTTTYKYGTGSLKNNPSNPPLNAGLFVINPVPVGTIMSFSMWVRKSDLPAVGQIDRIFEYSNGATGNSENDTIALDISSSGIILPILTNGSTSCFSTLKVPIISYSICDNNWNNIIWVITASNSYIYINGSIKHNDSIITVVPTASRPNAYMTYTTRSDINRDFSGNIDEFRYYKDKALNQAEIYQLSNNTFFNLDICGGFLANGSSVIYEPSGSRAGPNSGTLTLLHGDASGSSSIMFKSVNDPLEYGYIQYEENSAGSTGFHYGLMTIGIENDSGNFTTQADRVSLFPSGGTGYVGINTKAPTVSLDVSGQMRIYEGAGTVASTTAGSLVLEHTASGGTSSIMFKGPTGPAYDYAYVQYTDAFSAVQSLLKYDLSAGGNAGAAVGNVTFTSTGTSSLGLSTAPSTNTFTWFGATTISSVTNVNCISFNQTNVTLANTTSPINYLQTGGLPNMSSFTFSAWIRPTQITAGGDNLNWMIANLTNSNNDGVVDIYLSTNGLIYALVNDGGANYIYTSTTLQLNTWYHLVFTFDGINRNGYLYLNGVLRTTVELTGLSGVSLKPNNNLLIGMKYGWNNGTGSNTKYPAGTNTFKGFRGQMAFINVFDRAVTASDVDYLYNNPAYNVATNPERGLLTIGIENDTGAINNDRIVLWPGAGNGFVGINTRTPSTALDINGSLNASKDIFVNGLRIGRGPGDNTGNTVFGFNANPAASDISGYHITVMGFEALRNNTSGYQNTVFGCQAATACTTGNQNTIIGSGALSNLTTQSNNTAVGFAAGVGSNVGNQNTFLGSNTYMNSNCTNSTAIGYNTQITASNQVQLGNNCTAQAAAFNATSDYREKDNVADLDETFTVDTLRPVVYDFKPLGKKHVGFIAHEVQEYYPFLVTGEKDGPHSQTMNYNGFIGILTKEIKGLKKKVSEQEERLATQEERLQALEKLLFNK